MFVKMVFADFSTDGRWCYIVFWVTPDISSPKIDWDSLKNRLLSACPSCLGSFYFCLQSNVSKPPSLYLLKFFCRDRKGLLHGMCKVIVFCLVLGVFFIWLIKSLCFFGDS